MRPKNPKTAAEVGTDTATIYAISPEALYNLINEDEWREWADEMWGDSPQDPTISGEEPWEAMQRLIREHGGAYFQTGSDGTYDVKVHPTGDYGQGDEPPTIDGEGFLPPYGTPNYGKVAVRYLLPKRLATKYQARVVVARMKQAGWWAIDPATGSGGIDWGAKDKGTPKDEERYNGDGPADMMDEFLDKLDLVYRQVWGRPAYPEELRAVFEFCFSIVETRGRDGYQRWPLNKWVDEVAEAMGMSPKAIASLPQDKLKELSRYWRDYRNSGIQTGVAYSCKEGFPEPSDEALDEFLGHARLIVRHALTYGLAMYDIDPKEGGTSQIEVGIGRPFEMTLDAEKGEALPDPLFDSVFPVPLINAVPGKTASEAHDKSVALMKFLSGVAKSLGPEVGRHTYVVGGAVRDFVLDRPIKDVDVVIDSVALGGRKDSEWFAKQVGSSPPPSRRMSSGVN